MYGLAREASYLWGSVNNSIFKMTVTGTVDTSFEPNDGNIKDLAFDGTYIWMINDGGTIKKFTTLGILVDSIPNILSRGWGLTYENGYLWASDPNTDMIYKILVQQGIEDVTINDFKLKIYPNPFKEKTVIRGQGGRSNDIGTHHTMLSQITIYDLAGNLVRTFNLDNSVIWDGRNKKGKKVRAGIYFLYIEIDRCKIVRKLIKVR